jgi:hypothetical protein
MIAASATGPSRSTSSTVRWISCRVCLSLGRTTCVEVRSDSDQMRTQRLKLGPYRRNTWTLWGPTQHHTHGDDGGQRARVVRAARRCKGQPAPRRGVERQARVIGGSGGERGGPDGAAIRAQTGVEREERKADRLAPGQPHRYVVEDFSLQSAEGLFRMSARHEGNKAVVAAAGLLLCCARPDDLDAGKRTK